MSTRSYVPDRCDVVHLHPARVAELRQALIGEHEVLDLAETFRALGDRSRVRILDALSHGELCVCDLAAIVQMSESAVSHQLRVLRNLRVVRPRRAGRMVFYALDDRHIISLFRQGLRHVQEDRFKPGVIAPRRASGVHRGRAR